MSSFTNRSNAARAARRLIETGEAPASQFEIRDTVEGRFEIAWQTGPTTDEAPSAKVPTEDPELAAVDTPRLITELARRGYRTALARRPRVKRQPIERRPSKATQLDEAAARGIMPNKPVITSATNQHYQKRFDRLAELAAAGK